MKKRKKNTGTLNDAQSMAPFDERGEKRSVKQKEPKAPDGVSGDWT